jgi:hypothetical protein
VADPCFQEVPLSDRALEVQCARVLYERARAAGAGTRQQVRAAVRRLLRRERRDPGYLHWLLRCASASSALALALLGLAAAPAAAELVPYASRPGSANPLTLLDVGGYSTPSFGDLDGDGDLDAVSGEHFGQFVWLENVGDATSPTFVAVTGTASPLDGHDVGVFAVPALGDLDGDGVPDLVTGTLAGTFSVHYLPEPARGLMIGAGLSLLALLDRMRRRRG